MSLKINQVSETQKQNVYQYSEGLKPQPDPLMEKFIQNYKNLDSAEKKEKPDNQPGQLPEKVSLPGIKPSIPPALSEFLEDLKKHPEKLDRIPQMPANPEKVWVA